LAITLLAFMWCGVPAPAWKTSRTKAWSSLFAATRAAACLIARARRGQEAEAAVGPGGGELDQPERADDAGWAKPRELEGLRARLR
jgi:hypothetical protein